MYAVYVPHVHAPVSKTIAAGAGIVGKPAGEWHPSDSSLSDGRLVIDYEEPGPAANIITFADRVYHAYDRQLSRYPTHKRMWPLAEEFIHVADFFPSHGRVELAGGQEMYVLMRWLCMALDDSSIPALTEQLQCQGSGVRV